MTNQLTSQAKRHAFTALVIPLLLVPVFALADDFTELSKAEIVKLGKSATALIQVDKDYYGSAFCIHPSGLFITNNHVLRGPGSKINVILNSGLSNQQIFEAKVLRQDRELDLALLRIEAKDEIPALSLGTAESVQELTDVIVFGYPFGRELATGTEQYPAISINTGSISSLRRQGGELYRIQLNAAVNPGNSGGPLLDSKGAVLGVVQGRVEAGFGAGLDFAIPVNLLERFVARPEILFTPPLVTLAKQHESFDFHAEAISVVQSATPLDLEMILSSGSGPENRHAMTFNDGAYHVSAVPFPVPAGPPALRAKINYEDGSVQGVIEDRSFSFDGNMFKLSEINSLRFGPRSELQLSNAKKIEGSLSGLGPIPVRVGGQSFPLDLTKAVEMTVEFPGQISSVSCTIVALHAGKELGRLRVPIYVQGLARPGMETLRDGEFIMPPRSEAPISYLRAISDKADYIGQGKTYSYGGEELTLQRAPRGVLISVDGWSIEFGGPGQEFLGVGEYSDAKRHAFSGDSPGIDFNGNGRGCNTIAGKFVVWELEVQGTQIIRLAIDFIQRCEEKNPSLYGMIRFNSTFY